MKALKGKKLTAYSIGHEGTSSPRVIGEGNKSLSWSRAVVRRLANTVKAGVKFFIDHNSDSSTSNRDSVGEVVASTVKTIKDKLYAIVVGALDPDINMDVCSVEADIYEQNGIVNDVDEVTGIALGNSDKDKPAFAGAMKLASIQCFADSDGKSQPGKEDETVTFAELQKAARDLNVHPSQLFSEDDLKKDVKFQPLFDKLSSAETEVTTLKADLEKEKASGVKAKKDSEVSSSKTRLKELIPEGTTQKMSDFIISRFDPEKIDDLSDEGVSNFLKTATEEYSAMAKLFNVKLDDKTTIEKKEEKSEDGKKSDDPIDSMVDDIMK